MNNVIETPASVHAPWIVRKACLVRNVNTGSGRVPLLHRHKIVGGRGGTRGGRTAGERDNWEGNECRGRIGGE
jgi:hypothetical protein